MVRTWCDGSSVDVVDVVIIVNLVDLVDVDAAWLPLTSSLL
jgi:hypothetical protein